jgi:outer membrane protein assembly factor BamB
MSSVKSKLLLTMPIMLIMAFSLIASVPVTAQPWNTEAFCYWGPNPIGIGQTIVVEAWISPRPRYNQDFYYHYVFTITKPNGATETRVMNQTEHPGTIWFNYVPDQLGTYTIKFTWDGTDAPSYAHPPPGFTSLQWMAMADNYFKNASHVTPWISGDHNAAVTANLPLVVQQEQIPEWPAAPLPTDGWSYPINPENRAWAELSGAWRWRNYNITKGCYNPYTQGVYSPHILWTLPPYSGIGGLVGGEYGSSQYYPASAISFTTIMAGRGYATYNNQIHCYDIRTGQELWTQSGTFLAGQVGVSQDIFGPTVVANLIDLSPTSWRKIDAITGAVTLTRNYGGHRFTRGFGGTTWLDPYVLDFEVIGNTTYLVKWTTEGTASDANFASRVIWNVTYWDFTTQTGARITDYEFGRSAGPNVVTVGDYTTFNFVTYPIYGESSGWDMATGQLLWHRNIEDFESRNSIGGRPGYFFMTEWPDHWNMYNARTGVKVWTGEGATYPFGDFWAYQVGVDNNRMYGLNYDGHIYAYNLATGQFDWTYYVGSDAPYTMETPYNNTWPMFSGPTMGGGVIYVATSEWGTPHPYYRGQNLHAVNTFTGDGLWTLMGSWNPGPIAEGYFFATNNYDGKSYCFGKGPSLMEVELSDASIAAGQPIWITGRVTDQSPGPLNGDPCLSKDSLGKYIEWKLMQQPRPFNLVGVPVNFYASYPNGTLISIGSTVSDGEGYFSYKWSPPEPYEEHFIITASFNGDESYYSSYAVANLKVTPKPAAATPVEPTPAPIDYTPMGYGIIAAVVVLIIIGAVNIWVAFRKK